MGWRDFFYYSKSERRVIILLLGLIGVMIGVFWSRETPSLSSRVQVDTCFVDSFMKQLERRPVKQGYKRKNNTLEREDEKVVLFGFDPNTADSMTLRKLGIKPFVVRNILRYRLKGGVFRTPESFSKIYGLDKEEYLRLKPYLSIASLEADCPPVIKDSLGRDSFRRWEPKLEEGMVVNLNQADTTVLKRVPGIGSGIARMIVAYRTRLGGFYRVEQLQDIPYVDAGLNSWFEVLPADSIRKLRVNRAGLEELRNHPYMNFYKAKVILEYRRKRGNIKGLPQLSMFDEFTEEDLMRLSPYLSFE